LRNSGRFSHNTGSPVIDDGALVGVVTTSDLAKNFILAEDLATAAHSNTELSRTMAGSSGGIALKMSVGDVMTRDVITVSPRDYLHDAASLMHKNRIHRVFVTNGKKLAGVLSTFDFARLYAHNRIKAGHRPTTLDF